MSVALVSLAVKVDPSEVAAGVSALTRMANATTAAEIAAKSLADATRTLNSVQDAATKMGRDVASAYDKAADAQRGLAKSASSLSKAHSKAADDIAKAEKAATDAIRKHADEADRLDAATRKTTGGTSGAAAATKKLGAEAFESARKFVDLTVKTADLYNGLTSLMSGDLSFTEIISTCGDVMEAVKGISVALEGVGGAAVLLNPVTIGVGLIAGGFAIATQQINKNAGDITAGLGLTADQLASVKDKGVTMGDTLTGTFNVLAGAITGGFGPQLDGIRDKFGEWYQATVDGAVWAVGSYIGVYIGAFNAIRATWGLFPAAIGDVMISAANLAIGAVEKMINGGIGLINGLSAKASSFAAAMGLKIQAPQIDTVSIARLDNQFAGAAAKVGSTLASEMNKGMATGRRAVNGVLKDISDESVKVAQERIVAEAKKAEPKVANNACNCGPSSAAQTVHEAAPTLAQAAASLGQQPSLDVAFNARQMPKLGEEPAPAADGAAAAVEDTKAKVDALSQYAAKLAEIDKQTEDVGKSMEGAFGKVGKAIGDVASALVHYAATQAGIDAEKQAALDAIPADKNKEAETARITADAHKKSAAAQIASYQAVATAAKGYFGEQSAGYKVIQAAEQGYRAFQMASSIQAMFQHTAETMSVVTNGAAQATANAAAGATKIFAQLGMYAFPVVAAMVAVLASFGAKGGGGSGAVPGATDAKDRQESQGSGSVLGDSKAKSESLTKALDQQLKNQNKDLEYSNQMVASLRAIQSNIGVVASLLARQLGLSTGVFDTSGLQLGTSGKRATLANLGFGKTTTNTLQDLGLQFGAETLGSIIASGVDGSTYQQVLSQTKSKVFGITVGNKTSVNTTTGALDGDLTAEINRLIGSLREGVLEGAKALGKDSAAAIDAVVVNLGKISFKDLTGAQIEEQLNAVFGKLADDLAVAAVPVLTQFQKVGEGAFETLARVAREYQVVDVAFQSIGRTFGALGLDSLAARDHLVEAAGGLDAFTEQVGFYAENFLSDAERLKPVQESVATELQRLAKQYGNADIAAIKTKDQFKALVQTLNVTDQAGGDLFAAMMALAPAFAKVADAASAVADRRKSIQDEIDKLALKPTELIKRQREEEMAATVKLDASLGPLLQQFYDLSDAADAAAAATKLANDRRALEIQLMEARGDTAGALAAKRADDLKAIDDPVQRRLQQAVYDAQDAAAAVSAARDVLSKAYQRERADLLATSDKFKAFAANLTKFRDSLDVGPLAQLSPGDQYQASRTAFEQTAALARLGNDDALSSLQSVSEAYLGVAKTSAATAVDYQRDLASVKIAVEAAGDTASRTAEVADKQLAALDASVAGLIAIDNSVVGVAVAVNNLQGALQAARTAGVTSVGGLAIPGGSATGGGVYVDPIPTTPNLAAPYNPNQDGNANMAWLLMNSMAGKGNAISPTAASQAYEQVGATYKPGFSDIASVFGLDEAWKQYQAGQVGFARGGAFSNGVVLRPTAFNLAQMGEAGPEAIMPLTMGPNGLGVRAAGSGSDAKELRDLKAEVANLNVALMAIAENTGATARLQRRWDGDGLPAERNVA